MEYLPGRDYFVYYEELPWKVRAIVTPNEDTTFTIIINSRLSDSQKKSALDHEVDHIENEDC